MANTRFEVCQQGPDRLLAGLEYQVKMTPDGVAEIIPTEEEIVSKELGVDSDAKAVTNHSVNKSVQRVVESQEKTKECRCAGLLDEIFQLLDELSAEVIGGAKNEYDDNAEEEQEDKEWEQVQATDRDEVKEDDAWIILR